MKLIDANITITFTVPDNIENVDKAQIFIEDGKLVLWIDGERLENNSEIYAIDSIEELSEAETMARDFTKAKDLLDEMTIPHPELIVSNLRRAK